MRDLSKKFTFSVFKFFLLSLILGVFLVIILNFVFSAKNVEADDLVFYPEFCLGGWEKPQNASGQVDVPEGSDASLFNLENSAFLKSGVASQIFCGYFPIEEREEKPDSIFVKFNWVMKYKPVPTSVIIESEPSLFIPIEKVKKEDTFFESNKPENQTEQVEEEKIGDNSENSNVIDNLDSIESNQIQDEMAPVQEPAPSTTSSFFDFFIKKAHAQNFSSQDFAEISYSIDGVRWISIGRINQSNWQNYSANIPINSWEELRKIQIMINILPTTDEKPDIYLDGLSIVAEYNSSLAETAREGLENTANAVVSIIEIMGEKMFGLSNDNENVINKETESILVKEKKLFFEFGGRTIKVKLFCLGIVEILVIKLMT